MATELILVRHGYTVRVNGDYVHAPLTPIGEKQAAETGEYLNTHQQPIEGFYASPLPRAFQTATIIGTKINATPQIMDGIREVEGLEIPKEERGAVIHFPPARPSAGPSKVASRNLSWKSSPRIRISAFSSSLTAVSSPPSSPGTFPKSAANGGSRRSTIVRLRGYR